MVLMVLMIALMIAGGRVCTWTIMALLPKNRISAY